MKNRELFLSIDTYDEYDKKRDMFPDIDLNDLVVREHLKNLYPQNNNTDSKDGWITECYPIKCDE